MLVSVDPGVAYYGYACWNEGVLIDCGVVDLETRITSLYLAIEDQAIRKDTRRSRDIIRLAQSAGRISDRYEVVKWYLSTTWMGGSPREDQLHKRIMASLTDKERGCIPTTTKKDKSHILDAIGIGLYHLKRKF